MTSIGEGNGRHTEMPVESVTIVVPCYNEAPAIESLCDRLIPVLKELESLWKVQLLCIDDGSTDDTLALLRKYFEHAPGITADIVSHPSNLGLAEAMRTAFSAARGDVVCSIDSNLSYAPEELRGMIGLLENSGADIVAASPFHPRSALQKLPTWKIDVARAVSLFNAGLLPGKLTCYTGMFRAYRRQWFTPEYLHLNEFTSVVQILVDAILAGAKVVEYPITVNQRARSIPATHRLQAVCRHILFVARVQRRSFTRKRGPHPRYAASQEEVKRRSSI